jgi:hypothetical protein
MACNSPSSVSQLSRKMWKPRRLTNLWAFRACCRDSFILFLIRHWQLWYTYGSCNFARGCEDIHMTLCLGVTPSILLECYERFRGIHCLYLTCYMVYFCFWQNLNYITSNNWMFDERWIRKNLERNGSGISEVQFRKLTGATQEDHEIPQWIQLVATQDSNWAPSNMNLQLYYYSNPLGTSKYYTEDDGRMFLRRVSNVLPDWMASYPKRQQNS